MDLPKGQTVTVEIDRTKTFIDCFLPTPLVGKLTTDTWIATVANRGRMSGK